MTSSLMAAVEVFEAAEANLVKLERLWDETRSLIPPGIVFGENPQYEDRCRSFQAVLSALPKIAGWKPDISLPDLSAIAHTRLEAAELSEPLMEIQVGDLIDEPGRDIREYRFRFNQARRQLIRDALVELIDGIDADLREIQREVGEAKPSDSVSSPRWDALISRVDQIDGLLGSSVSRPPQWSVLQRHLHFALVCDLNDIQGWDWPAVKAALRGSLYGVNEPLPVQVDDLSDLVAAKPRGSITTKLDWAKLDAEAFERLIFTLIGTEPAYENPEWLMRTNAPDRGRDLSVTRVIVDNLAGTQRLRVVIQCKHWLERSVNLTDVSATKDQVGLWTDPRVDVLVVATSGRFTSDAVQWIEKHNGAGNAPRIEMWPESHVERLLAARPALIAEFKLR